jgi:hypothetical protein
VSLFRIYEPHECGDDGYPLVWHAGIPVATDGPGTVGVKHIVRGAAEDRCERCFHPFIVGESGEYADAPGERRPEALTIPFLGADSGFGEAPKPPTPRAVNWSVCSEECRHNGPVRWRLVKEGGWHYEPEGITFDMQGIRQLRSLGVEQVQAAWRILTVHHLNERKEDLRWHNLAALCQRCHLIIQRKVVMKRAWPWDHSDWFKPYAAAHYAIKYGMNDAPTREWTMENLDLILAKAKEQEAVERMPV